MICASLRFFHGTAAAAFVYADEIEAAAGNVGFHFGTRAAALDRIRFLREQNPRGEFRLLECALDIRKKNAKRRIGKAA